MNKILRMKVGDKLLFRVIINYIEGSQKVRHKAEKSLMGLLKRSGIDSQVLMSAIAFIAKPV